MRVHCDEGVANHIDPEPCVSGREGRGWGDEGHKGRDVDPHNEWPDEYEDPDQTEIYDCDGCDK